MPDNSPFISSLLSSATIGQQVTCNFGRIIWACWYAGGADVGARSSFQGPLNGTTNINLTSPSTAGTYTIRAYDAQTGGNLLAQSGPITIMQAQVAETGVLSGVPTSGSAGVALMGGTYTLQNGTSAYVGLFNVTTGAYQGSLVQVTGASGNLPSFTPSVQDTFAYKLTSDSAGATVLFTSPNITVGAAPDVVLTGLPASIAAGQPLASTYFTLNNGAYGDLILWDQTAGAPDGITSIADTVTPDGSLDFLVPQNAGHEYVVQLVTPGSSPPTVLWQSASFAVTAAPGALPAQISSFTTSGATTTQVTLNWSAVSGATGYQVLARTSAGSKWGSLANTVVSGTSYTFTGLTAGAAFFPIVTAINANGRGPANQTVVSTASS